MNFLILPIFQFRVPSGMLSRKIVCRCWASLGHSVNKWMNVSGASLHKLHSGATGWPIRFWCFDKKLCPVSVWRPERDGSNARNLSDNARENAIYYCLM